MEKSVSITLTLPESVVNIIDSKASPYDGREGGRAGFIKDLVFTSLSIDKPAPYHKKKLETKNIDPTDLNIWAYRIVRMLQKNMTYTYIANHLNREGSTSPRGKAWNAASVRKAALRLISKLEEK